MKKILLFDIDGTLLQIDRKFMQKIIRSIMRDMNIAEEALSNVSFAGNTDTAIFRSLLEHKSSNINRFPKIKEAYVHALTEQLNIGVVNVFKEVKTTLKLTQSDGYEMGLLTGNFIEIAYHKLKLAGLDHFFSFGAFGCSHPDRNELGPIAQKNYEKLKNSDADPEQFVIIGDTPRDIACARAFGCACVIVTTGHFSRKELAEYDPDLILDRLSAPREWMHQIS